MGVGGPPESRGRRINPPRLVRRRVWVLGHRRARMRVLVGGRMVPLHSSRVVQTVAESLEPCVIVRMSVGSWNRGCDSI